MCNDCKNCLDEELIINESWTHNDDCLPHLNITHYFFQMFFDADLFQKFLG